MAKSHKLPDSIKRLRTLLLSEREDALASFRRQLFNAIGVDKSQHLSLEELKKAVHHFGMATLSDERIKQMFNNVDKDHSGTIDFEEFIQAIRFMSKRRKQVVQETFERADQNGDGVIDIEDLKGIYKSKGHPKYVNGEWDEQQVFEEFLNSFEPDKSKRNGKITSEQYMNYYIVVNALVDEDAYFQLMVKSPWDFPRIFPGQQ